MRQICVLTTHPVRLESLFPSLATFKHQDVIFLKRDEIWHPVRKEKDVALQDQQGIIQRLLHSARAQRRKTNARSLATP